MPARRRSNPDARKLTTRQFIAALWRIAVTVYHAAPTAIIVQLVGTLVTAILPIVTTYFAAMTTSALAAAYAGEAAAGARAVEYVIITAVLGVVMTAWRSLENYLSQMMRYRIEVAMSDTLFDHFLNLDFWRYDDKDTADLYEKARKFMQFFPYLFERLSSIVTSCVSMIAGISALLFVSWWLALIALCAVVPGVYIQFRLSRFQTQHWNDNILARRTVNWIEWGIMKPESIAEVRLYGLVRHLLDLRQAMRDKDERVRIEFERSFIWKRFAADFFQAAMEVIALVWIAVQIIHRQQPIGQFLYVQQLVSRAISGAESLISNINSVDEDVANLFDYQQFMDLPEGNRRGTTIDAAPSEIALRDVCFHYQNAKDDVLHGISLTIDRGAHVAIVGENGAGKSTLIKLITGLYRPTHGDIMLDGVSLAAADLASWHGLLGVLSQDFVKYDFATAKQNIYFGDTNHAYSAKRLNKAIDRAEARFLQKLPYGLDTYVDKWMEDDEKRKGQDLSGGQWQRLALARNFYRDAPIIILDEPTSAIDALAETRIFKQLFALQEKTIITVSHRLTTVEKADVIYMLENGHLVEQGTAAELIAKKGKFYRMFESQIRQ